MQRRVTPRVYTIGYEQRNLEEFVDLLRAARIDVLVDVRETAWSHKPGFSKRALAKAIAESGMEYHHAQWCGNPKWIRSVADSHADCLALYRQYIAMTEGLIDALIDLVSHFTEDGRRICLVCYERHPGDCHRGILAELIEAHGAAVVHHIAPDGRPRHVES